MVVRKRKRRSASAPAKRSDRESVAAPTASRDWHLILCMPRIRPLPPGIIALGLGAILSLPLAPPAHARTLVVNPAARSASDDNPGTDALPLRTIGRAAADVEPGDVVRIRAGTYREQVVIKRSGTSDRPIRFEAAAGADVVVSGADEFTHCASEGGETFSIDWPHDFFQGDERNPGGVEQVIASGRLLRKVTDRGKMADGTFFVDRERRRMYWRAAGAGARVEASTRALLWRVEGEHVQTRGLRFRHAANRAQRGMAQFTGANATIADCVFEWANSTGADFLAHDIAVLRCVFRDNGQQGFKANHADRLRFDGCTIERNNVKNFPRGWEAGGNKLCNSREVVLENSRFLRNRGCGVWFDITNVDCTVRNCLIADNEDAGIFYEISHGLHAHDNVIVGNGFARNKGAWGANGGICVSSSPGCVIERNLIVGNLQGFCFREQNRTTRPIAALALRGDRTREPPAEPIWIHDEVVRLNLIADNAVGQVQGWFDIATERHWPRALQSGAGGDNERAADDVAAPYQARKDGVPPGLALEDLNLVFNANCYAVQPGQPFFIWGANWKRKQAFAEVASVRAALGLEDARSQFVSTAGLDIARRDFRLPRDHPALQLGAYPRGPVPDCRLGVRE